MMPDENRKEPTGPPRMEDIVPEEYYGLTNPMANSWPGSKHEEYGGYLKKLGDSADSSSTIERKGSSKHPAQATRQGSYLENL